MYLRSLKFSQANLLSRSTWCSRVSTEVSEPLFRMPRVLFVFLRWLCFFPRVSWKSPLHVPSLRDVTGEALFPIGGLLSFVLRWKALLLVLRCYGFTKSWIRLASCLSPMLEARVQRSFQVVRAQFEER